MKKRLLSMLLVLCMVVSLCSGTAFAAAITCNLQNITVVGGAPTHTTDGQDLNLTLQAADGYELPDSITVRVGMATLTQGTDYTYNKATGALSIPSSKLSAFISIQGAAVRYHAVTMSLTGLTATPDTKKVEDGGTLSVTLKPQDNYDLPETITVTMADDRGTINLEAGTGYTYTVAEDKKSAALSVSNVTGAVAVTAVGISNVWTITANLTNLTTKAAVPATVSKTNTGLTVELVAAEGYKLPDTVTVTMGGAAVSNSYNKTTGVITIAEVTGNVVITAKGKQITYEVDTAGLKDIKVRAGGNPVYPHGGTLALTLEPVNACFEMPETITVAMEGQETAPTFEYKVATDKKSATLNVPNATGKVTLTGEAVRVAWAVTYDLTNVEKVTAPDTIVKDGNLEVTVKAKDGYELPKEITVKMGSSELLPGTSVLSGYTYDSTTGKIVVKTVTADVAITVKAEIKDAPVLSGLTVSSGTLTPAFAAETFEYEVTVKPDVKEITVTPKVARNSGYTIKVDNKAVESGKASEKIELKPGENTITIAVTDPVLEFTSTYTVLVKRPMTITAKSLNEDGKFYGTIKLASTEVMPGEDVTFTIELQKGYKVKDILVVDEDSKEVTLAAVSGVYSFTMPASTATICVEFEPDGSVWENPYSDVKEANWYYEAVRFVDENGLMNGVGGGKFGPLENVSRGMVVTILWRLEGEPTAASAGFTDAGNTWYTTAINWAASKGIVDGIGNNKFAPNNAVTREQLAAMLYRYAKYKGLDVSGTNSLIAFTDRSSVSSWALASVKWAVSEKIIQGSNGYLDPRGTANRAQLAQILTNFLGE